MKRLLINTVALMAVAGAASYADDPGRLVILHSNDTHSQLDPTDKGLGGVLRRKVLVDSVRAAEPNVLLVDAGDAVQGTMYFNLFGGEAEAQCMNMLGYDIAILGNHEFDNGMKALAHNVGSVNTTWLATNYDVDDSALAGMFRPYVIKEYDGRRIAFIALNLDPYGMVAEGNYDGVVYNDVIEVANVMSRYLKEKHKADMVVALTHIGYKDMPGPDDCELAAASHDIDIIIGGHSHTRVAPGGDSVVLNADGRPVFVTQTGKSGLALGEVSVDLATLRPEYKLIAVDGRLDGRIRPEDEAVLQPYRHAVDSVMSIPVSRTDHELAADGAELQNFLADFIMERGGQLADGVDLALINKGSIRRSLPGGVITRGMIIMMQPFSNHIEVLEVKGSDLREAFDVMASRDGDGVSRGTEARFDPSTGKCMDITIDGKPLDDNRVYRVATIDYLANGGDYMTPLTRGVKVSRSDDIVYEDLLRYLAGKPDGYTISGDRRRRMVRSIAPNKGKDVIHH